ncbi:MAG: DegT/DnrJ/EryC1/StrS family aminotransferase [Firmicutes bacterium]|nr:DegT/DnrJ/EryC1/StrS family aminotransferase [Bacillota bacterium]
MRFPMASAEVNDEDIEEVLKVLRSKRLALGPKMEEFENAVADYVGVKHAVAVSSGTAALHLLVRALGLGEGDEVLVPSFTFISSANVLLYERVKPVFVDIDPETYNLDPDDLERKITGKTRAIMAVDVFGQPVEWDEVLRIAEKHDLLVIDDSCEALGGEYKCQKLGRFGNAAAFAFYPNKQMTTGEGGMIVTDDDRLECLCRSMRNQGRGGAGAWLEHERLGYNYRMDEMSAALGLSQMRRLEAILARREWVAERYTECLRGIEWVRPPIVRPHVRMSWFVYVICLGKGINRQEVMNHLERHGIDSRPYFSAVHLQPFYRELFGYRGGELPVTEDVSSRTLALPFYNDLTQEEIADICGILASKM